MRFDFPLFHFWIAIHGPYFHSVKLRFQRGLDHPGTAASAETGQCKLLVVLGLDIDAPVTHGFYPQKVGGQRRSKQAGGDSFADKQAGETYLMALPVC